MSSKAKCFIKIENAFEYKSSEIIAKALCDWFDINELEKFCDFLAIEEY